MTKIKKKLTFFRHVELPKQTAPPAGAFRRVPARHGAIQNWTSGLSPNPYTHARVSKTGGSRSPQLPQINLYLFIHLLI